MHGHTDTLDAFWNFSERDVSGVDYRAIEWLQAQHEKAMSNWFDEQFEIEEAQRAERENRERDELARLKEKYEPETQ